MPQENYMVIRKKKKKKSIYNRYVSPIHFDIQVSFHGLVMIARFVFVPLFDYSAINVRNTKKLLCLRYSWRYILKLVSDSKM